MNKTTPADALRHATHSLSEQLAMMRSLEAQIQKRVLDESCERILRDADELLGVRHDTHEGGQ